MNNPISNQSYLGKFEKVQKTNQQIKWDNPPSKKVFKFVVILRLGLAISLILSLFFTTGCSQELKWRENQNIGEIAAKENTYLTSFESVKTSVLAPELVLIDYNDSSLCGLAGCLFDLYFKGQKVWSKYLKTEMPPGWSMFSTVTKNDLPCLQVTQYRQRKIEAIYCYNNQSFTLENKTES